MPDDRRFYFEPSTPMLVGLETIRAALDDEGLALGPRASSADSVTSVIVDGQSVFIVPGTRIMTREADASMRAQFRLNKESAS